MRGYFHLTRNGECNRLKLSSLDSSHPGANSTGENEGDRDEAGEVPTINCVRDTEIRASVVLGSALLPLSVKQSIRSCGRNHPLAPWAARFSGSEAGPTAILRLASPQLYARWSFGQR